MRKIWIITLAVCLLAVFCCGCNTPSEDPATSPGSFGNSTSTQGTTKTSTATATKEPTPTPEPTPEPPPAENPAAYTIEYDTVINDESLGFLFAGYDDANYIMAQLSIGYIDDGYLYYRPHEWVDGAWEVLDEVPIDPEVAPAEYGATVHMKLVMKNNILTAYINGTEICDVRVWDGTYGMIGFRAVNEEWGAFDNLSIANSEGTVFWTEDFEGETTYFDDAIADELDGYIENGVLTVGKNANVEFLMEPPALQ